MIMKLALLGALLYSLYPDDTSGLPYPDTVEEMRAELAWTEEFLRTSERRFREIEAQCQNLVYVRPFSQETSDALGEYSKWLVARHNAQCRINNLNKLIGKYEEINTSITLRDSAPIGV